MTKKSISSQAVIWCMLLLAVIVFVVTKYKLSTSLSDSKKELNEVRVVRQEQLDSLSQEGLLNERISQHRNAIQQQQEVLNCTFNVFSQPEMAKELIAQLDVPSDVGLLIARKTFLNYGRSFFTWLPKGKSQQQLVVYAKTCTEGSPGLQFDLFRDPDHRIEFSMPQEQLTDLTIELDDAKSGWEFTVRLGEQEETVQEFEGRKPGGWSTYGMNSHAMWPNRFNVNQSFVDSGKTVQGRDFFLKQGIWNLVYLGSYQLVADDDEKQLQVAVVLESTGPLYYSPVDKYRTADSYSLEWDDEEAAYRIVLAEE